MALLPATMPRTTTLRAGWGRTLRAADLGSGVVCGLALGLLAALLIATAVRYRPLIDHSDSMRPAIRAGDLLITHAEPAASIRVGQIVSFDDPGLDGKLVTHRVVAISGSARRIDFLTRGDANPTPESWSVARAASVQTLKLRIAGAGRAVAWVGDPLVRRIVLALVALVLGTALLRRIWRA
ncbi:MAG TPA: signal peptidase I [Solirubrobacteraceae bacterium]|jgi:signal peptidase